MQSKHSVQSAMAQDAWSYEDGRSREGLVPDADAVRVQAVRQRHIDRLPLLAHGPLPEQGPLAGLPRADAGVHGVVGRGVVGVALVGARVAAVRAHHLPELRISRQLSG